MNCEEKENYLILRMGFQYSSLPFGKVFSARLCDVVAEAAKRIMYILVASEFDFMKLIPKTATTC